MAFTDAKGNLLKTGDHICIHGTIEEFREDGTVFIRAKHGKMMISVLPENVLAAEAPAPSKPEATSKEPPKKA